ncbi:MAG: hypothetical protein ACXVFQ_26135, partial [Solirubrobacteraceae bacterium]
MPKSIIHVSAELTRETGCTIRVLRIQRALHRVWRVRPSYVETRVVGSFFEVFGGGVELLPVALPDCG